MLIDLTREAAREAFRQAAIDALDQEARFLFSTSARDAGATDEDLPALFRAIDALFDKTSARHAATYKAG
jgi:hypothetical protein